METWAKNEGHVMMERDEAEERTLCMGGVPQAVSNFPPIVDTDLLCYLSW